MEDFFFLLLFEGESCPTQTCVMLAIDSMTPPSGQEMLQERVEFVASANKGFRYLRAYLLTEYSVKYIDFTAGNVGIIHLQLSREILKKK